MANIDINYVFFIGGLLLTIAILASKLSAVFGTPILLLFLAIGMLSGEDGIFFHIVYNDYSSAYFIANLMLAVILLDGGLRTNFRTFRSVASESVLLATIGVVFTSAITGLGAYLLFDLTIVEAMLVGSIVGSTDAAAVFSLLGNGGVHLKERISSTLQIESATNDPMAILLTVVLISAVNQEATGAVQIAMIFLSQFLIGIFLGVTFGFFARLVIPMINISSGLYMLLVLGIGLCGFAVTASLGGSGFLAIFIIGMFIGNQDIRPLSYILPVGEGLTWLAQITLFLLLGLLVTPHKMLEYAVPGIMLALVLAFIARPIAVFLCVKPFFKRYTNKEIAFMSWVGIRGSVPIVLAIYPVMKGVPDAQLYFNVAFIVVLFSLLVQGASLVVSAKLFKVYAPASDAPINKSELGILVSDDFALYNYEIKREGMEGVSLRSLRFPKRSRIAAIFRDSHILKAQGDLQLKRGDIVSVIGHSTDEILFNSVFAQDKPPKYLERYTGDIILNGSEKMSELSKAYGIELTSFEEDMNLSEFMDYHIGGFAETGESISLIDVRLTVVEMSGDKVNKVGLTKLVPETYDINHA